MKKFTPFRPLKPLKLTQVANQPAPMEQSRETIAFLLASLAIAASVTDDPFKYCEKTGDVLAIRESSFQFLGRKLAKLVEGPSASPRNVIEEAVTTCSRL
ncbi:hypothetical protein ACCT14_08015 [Rhizobium brockwellii]|uniref:hypothetical protein n=1 Tax=Rhizobium brockwellii TaxID=3019932 RepID=UPI003F994897